MAAYLGRFQGASRAHAASDLGIFLTWCTTRGLDPLTVHRAHLELYVRWLQETRRHKPSTVSRRVSVLTGFYRTAVIDGVLEVSPAEHLRRPTVPPESPTLGLTHLQFEALLTAARTSPNRCDYALVAMLGLLGLRIFEACGLDIGDLREEHGHRVLRVVGKGTKIVLVPLPPAVARAIDQAIAGRIDGPILLNTRGTRMDRHAATRRLRHLAEFFAGPVSGSELAALISATGSISMPCATAWSITCRANARRARWLWIEVMAMVIALMPIWPPRNAATSGAQSLTLLENWGHSGCRSRSASQASTASVSVESSGGAQGGWGPPSGSGAVLSARHWSTGLPLSRARMAMP